MPNLTLPALLPGQVPVRLQALRGQVHVINLWASWCAPCRLEHPLLVDLKRRRPQLRLVGINFKDQRPAALRWLEELGNPFAAIGFDPQGRAGPALRLIGLPETLVVDRQGLIRLKHIGPLTEAAMQHKVEPLLDAL